MKTNYFLNRIKYKIASILFLSVTLLALQFSTFADAPVQQKMQSVGFYRMQLGDFEVTALYDGYLQIDNKNLLKNIKENEIEKLLKRMFITNPNVQTAVNAYLVNTGKNLVLVDVGSAKCFGATAGFIQDAFKASGYEPSQVDTVVITHLHPDHVCGITTIDGKKAFPNALVRMSNIEAEFWLDPKTETKMPKDFKPYFKMVKDAIQPYKNDGTFKPFFKNEHILPGLTAIPTPGHTPGHTSYEFKSQNETLLVLGDIIHSHAVQFPHPEASILYDADSKKAMLTRKKLFTEAAKNKIWLAGEHLPFPGIGHIRSEGKGYVWVPVEYAPYATNR